MDWNQFDELLSITQIDDAHNQCIIHGTSLQLPSKLIGFANLLGLLVTVGLCIGIQLMELEIRTALSELIVFTSFQAPFTFYESMVAYECRIICTTDSLGAGVSVTGSPKGVVYMDRTVWTDVRHFLERDRNLAAMQELKVILDHEISGSSSTLISIKEPSLQLVEYGLAWLTNKSQLELKNIDDFFSGRKERWIRLEEPAVLRVLYHHFMTDSDSCQDMLISKGQGDHSKIGLGLEKLAAFGEAQELDGKVPAEFVRQFLHQENKVLLRNDTFKVPGISTKA
ncbi:hypothetical protein SELMODRAFT_428206 [Selaginella moellendorffii]|uniref:Uncharacterized protein n=1 Tax=Selaginella moellendorffii TaxID=88036 RepID=D8T235_SELML|nr:hypothetical protein SELMODRAFT_428206 [Selaginella moellendorffii]